MRRGAAPWCEQPTKHSRWSIERLDPTQSLHLLPELQAEGGLAVFPLSPLQATSWGFGKTVLAFAFMFSLLCSFFLRGNLSCRSAGKAGAGVVLVRGGQYD